MPKKAALKSAKDEVVVEYAVGIAEKICERIVLGEPVRQIALLPGMPGETTIYRWLLKYPEFRVRYLEAKGLQAERLAEEVLEIADDGRNDWVRRESVRTGKVTMALDSEAVQRSKLRVAARQWVIARNTKAKAGLEKVDSAVPASVNGDVRVMTEERRALLMAKKREVVLRRLAAQGLSAEY